VAEAVVVTRQESIVVNNTAKIKFPTPNRSSTWSKTVDVRKQNRLMANAQYLSTVPQTSNGRFCR